MIGVLMGPLLSKFELKTVSLLVRLGEVLSMEIQPIITLSSFGLYLRGTDVLTKRSISLPKRSVTKNLSLGVYAESVMLLKKSTRL